MIREEIKRNLLKKNMSQYKLSKTLNIDPANLNKFIHGKNTLSIKYIEEILSYFNIKFISQ